VASSIANKLDDLKSTIYQGRCIAFLGAGVSMPEYIDWNGLVDRLCKACKIGEKFPMHIDSKSRTELAALAKEADGDAYEGEIRTLMKPQLAVPERYQLLAKLPFASYLTTNFENSLAIALQHKPVAGTQYPDLQANHGSGLGYFLHGLISDDAPLKIVEPIPEPPSRAEVSN